MLEFSYHCSRCLAPNGGIALPPWRWWYLIMGARCRKCGHVTPPGELISQAEEQERRHRSVVEEARAADPNWPYT